MIAFAVFSVILNVILGFSWLCTYAEKEDAQKVKAEVELLRHQNMRLEKMYDATLTALLEHRGIKPLPGTGDLSRRRSPHP